MSDLEKNADGFGRLSASVKKRFDAVDAALLEQRKYTEFAFDRLSVEMGNGFERINERLDGVEGINGRLDGVQGRFDNVDARFSRLERKLDQFIDTQSTTNALVERRLTALEPRPRKK